MILLPTFNFQNSTLPFLSPIFSSHMVLQRDTLNSIWGWSVPGQEISVNVGGVKSESRVDNNGKWMVKIRPPATGGPYTLTAEVVGDSTTKVILTDVLVGDVWLCTGQSNMEFGVGNLLNPKEVISKANYPNVRLFIEPHQFGFEPRIVNGGSWNICTPENIAQGGWNGFSAIGYYFGRILDEKLHIPIGLVADYWGGTSAESWTSNSTLRKLTDFNSDLDTIDQLQKAGASPIGTYVEEWLELNDPFVKNQVAFEMPNFDDSQWDESIVPATNPNFTGSMYYRKEVDLPDPLPGGTATLHLGPIQDDDWTWVNGKSLGSNSGGQERNYWLWPNSIQPGKNVLAIRTFNGKPGGGLKSEPQNMYIELGDGTKIPLAGSWKTKAGGIVTNGTPAPRNTDIWPNLPTVLYNGMIAPIAPISFKGVIWYQGETNSGRGYQYRSLLPAMIKNWRATFQQGDFPFYIVSLAAFGPRAQTPGDDYWAELREAQALTADKIKNSGLALAIDIGNATDIHPKDKKTVGERLALIALAKTYGEPIVYSGPVYKSMKINGNEIKLSFDHTDKGLSIKGNTLNSVQIAGIDHKWFWAQAKIVGNQIVAFSPDVLHPVAVRYAWSSNPDANLYNGAGLPAVPFRTDNWPELSLHNK